MKAITKYFLIAISVLIVFISATSVYAYLCAYESKTYTFGFSDEFLPYITQNFKLLEHAAVDANNDGTYELMTSTTLNNSYTIYPGVNIPKDPYVTFDDLLDEAFVFVEIVGESDENFVWSVRDCWLETGLIGLNGGSVYVYCGDGTEAVMLDPEADDHFVAYILSGIDGSANGGIEVSDSYKNDTELIIDFYGYLVQAKGFDDYQTAWKMLIGG